MNKSCTICEQTFKAKRESAKYCSTKCRVASSRIEQAPNKRLSSQAAKLGLPPLEEVDRTRAFSEEDMQKIRQLPREEWLSYMERPNSNTVMPEEERLKHYVSDNFPPIRYHSVNGAGVGSPNPPK